MQYKNIYTSVACNRTCECADWNANGLIIFGARNSIAIFDTQFADAGKITKTYTEHTGRVNSVKWIKRSAIVQPSNVGAEDDLAIVCHLDPGAPNAQVLKGRLSRAASLESITIDNDLSPPSLGSTEFITGGGDGLAMVWNISDPDAPKVHVLKGHLGDVIVVESIDVDGQLTLATSSTDSSIKLWHWDQSTEQYICFQTIDLPGMGFCCAMKMAFFPNTQQILFVYASDDDKVHLLTDGLDDEGKRVFSTIHTLVGHEDWVRGLDIIDDKEDLLLASSSQDTFIRLWRISPRSRAEVDQNKVDLFNIPEGDIHVEEKIITVKSKFDKDDLYQFAVSLESVLQGHEGWVYAVHWNRNEDGLQLLSGSMDKSLIIWSPTEDGIWMEKVRVGEVGGNSLGFFVGKLSADGRSIFGHGFQGSFHMWTQSSEDESVWNPRVIVGGHFGEVRDIEWEPKGQFLFSVSADQTTRIHAPWIRNTFQDITWHELARPQIHGYDMQCIAVLSRYKFVSGAEEKILRSFQAPANFVENLMRICAISEDPEGKNILQSMPKGASVPSLGLSNKAVYESDGAQVQEKHVKDEYPENYFEPVTLDCPPQEETLMQNTLWPEVQKLYGHGFEIFAVCASPDGKLLASSCKATNAEHAQIILWDTATWKQIQKLPSHQLTVTQIKFSPNGRYLLSVSRDRRWTVFENKAPEGTNVNFELAATTDKKNGIHARIIWSCDWSHDSSHFVTSSRDGKVVIWGKTKEVSDSSLKDWKAVDCLDIKNESVTAVAVFKHEHPKINGYLIAVGMESGLISLYSFDVTSSWKQLISLNKNSSHHLAVKKLQFRPHRDTIQLASCGDDHFVRIYEFLL